jgi:hypothetical protein
MPFTPAKWAPIRLATTEFKAPVVAQAKEWKQPRTNDLDSDASAVRRELRKDVL